MYACLFDVCPSTDSMQVIILLSALLVYFSLSVCTHDPHYKAEFRFAKLNFSTVKMFLNIFISCNYQTTLSQIKWTTVIPAALYVWFEQNCMPWGHDLSTSNTLSLSPKSYLLLARACTQRRHCCIHMHKYTSYTIDLFSRGRGVQIRKARG